LSWKNETHKQKGGEGMLTLQETKEFLRVDGDEEDALISSLILTAKDLTEDVMRRKLTDFDELPETVRQAMLILVATLYEERQVSKGKTGVSVADTLDLVRRMLFAYRKGAF
jgi:uncharacterized phage protein (predicted DNA packaging)